jgi:Rieske Fe-S protein
MPGHPAPFVPVCRLTRRAFVSGAVGAIVVGCSRASKWETKRVAVEDGIVQIDTRDYPELVTPGGMVALTPETSRRPVLVMRIEHGQFRVMSLRCPHLGCTVRWDNEEQLLRCPCHGSRFRDDGSLVRGPAKTGLEILESRTIGTRVEFRAPEA